jgi:hypothetical protein
LSDRERARRMGESGQQRVQEFFTERAVVEHQIDVYRKLLRERGLWPDGSS